MKTILKFLLAQLSSAACLLFILQASISMAADEAPRFQAILDAAVEEGVRAVSVHVSWDENSWSGTAGASSSDTTETLSPDSIFRLASISKLFTATIILQLVDEGVLELSDLLIDHLSDSPVSDLPYADLITIEMLLDHSSGIYSYSDADDFWDEAYRAGGLDRIWSPAELIAYAVEEKSYFDPSSKDDTHYSNSNYILLGMIIEKATGEALANNYSQRIYEPLDLEHTLLEGFGTGIESVQHSFMKRGLRNRVVARSRDWNGAQNGFYDVSGNYLLYNAWAWAAGGIASTSRDVHEFLLAVRDGSLLSEASQEILFRMNSAEGDTAVVFGGSGGWEGITTSAYEINGDIRIVILMNTTGIDSDANVLRGQLYRVLVPD